MRRLVAFILLLSAAVFMWRFIIEYQKVAGQDITAWNQDHTADCAIVLTGGPGRVREGFDLLAQGAIQKLIISGVHPYAKLREIFPQWPYYGGLSEEDVVLERRSTTTYGNVQQSLPLVEALHCRDVVIVTSRLHMYRAFKTFEAVFPAEIGLYSRAILSGPFYSPFDEAAIESFKSMFYSIWAYR